MLRLQTARAGAPLASRWQEMLNVYLSTLINNIVPLGFTADQFGLVVRPPPARPLCAMETKQCARPGVQPTFHGPDERQ